MLAVVMQTESCALGHAAQTSTCSLVYSEACSVMQGCSLLGSRQKAHLAAASASIAPADIQPSAPPCDVTISGQSPRSQDPESR